MIEARVVGNLADMSPDMARRPSILAAAAIALTSGACLKPDYSRCSIRCDQSGDCPGGYSCSAADGFCHESGADSQSCATSTDDGGTGPAIDAPDAMPLPTSVDILFVIDNSAAMVPEQTALLAAFPQFIAALDAAVGERPSLHVGVISTDLGAGPFGIQGCSGSGDNGVLQAAAQVAGCTPPTGAFISDVPSAGGRTVNYPVNQIAPTFSCIASLGDTGCGFEQPFESMRRALDGRNPANEGFRRPDASLAVILLSDEDDCSASNTDLFDTSQTSNNSVLGPLSSFRCFEFGVVCEPDSRLDVGARDNCVPRDGSPYIYDVADFVAFLGTLAPPERLTVAAIAGPPTPVAVARSTMDTPEVPPSCTSAISTPDPAIRIAAFAGAFPGRSFIADVCADDDFAPVMTQIAELVAATVVSE